MKQGIRNSENQPGSESELPSPGNYYTQPCTSAPRPATPDPTISSTSSKIPSTPNGTRIPLASRNPQEVLSMPTLRTPRSLKRNYEDMIAEIPESSPRSIMLRHLVKKQTEGAEMCFHLNTSENQENRKLRQEITDMQNEKKNPALAEVEFLTAACA